MNDVSLKILGGTAENEGKVGESQPLGVCDPSPERCPGSRGSGMMCAGCQAQTDAALKWLHQIPAPGGAFSEKKTKQNTFSPLKGAEVQTTDNTSTCLAFDIDAKGEYERPVKPDLGHVVPVLGWQQGL